MNVKRNLQKSSCPRGIAGMPETLLPEAVREKKLHPHDESSVFPLLAVDHAGKAVEAALERANVEALVGRPLLFRQNAGAVKTHIPGGRHFVGDQVQAHQRYGHFERSAILGPPRRTRVHTPPRMPQKTPATVGTGWQR